MKALFLLILLLPSVCLAQINQTYSISADSQSISVFLHQACPAQTPEYQVTFSQEPLSEQFNFSSVQIRAKDNDLAEERTLGLFTDKFQIQTRAQYHYALVAGQSCKSIQTIIIHINLTPTLYVAHEASGFSCTFNRVRAHEMKHYAITSDAYSMLRANIAAIVRPYYDNLPVIYNDSQDYQQIFYARSQEMNQAIERYLEMLKKPGNDSLDNRDNYLREEQLCSTQENQTLKKMLF